MSARRREHGTGVGTTIPAPVTSAARGGTEPPPSGRAEPESPWYPDFEEVE